VLVRDERVAGSNPATSTKLLLHNSDCCNASAQTAHGVPGQLLGQKRDPTQTSRPLNESRSEGERRKLARQADAILRKAGCDTTSGARKDRQFCRNKSAELKKLFVTGARNVRILVPLVQPQKSEWSRSSERIGTKCFVFKYATFLK
jgi:hypothetical protein